MPSQKNVVKLQNVSAPMWYMALWSDKKKVKLFVQNSKCYNALHSLASLCPCFFFINNGFLNVAYMNLNLDVPSVKL